MLINQAKMNLEKGILVMPAIQVEISGKTGRARESKIVT
jgi:hypothetical protein